MPVQKDQVVELAIKLFTCLSIAGAHGYLITGIKEHVVYLFDMFFYVVNQQN